jgi:endonuclease/exonuclease/phosphatase family metal-dependent hydrolase
MFRIRFARFMSPIAIIFFFSVPAAFSASQSFPATPNHSPLKILTFNFNSEDVPNDSDFVIRDLRFNAICNWIKQNDPDVVFLQEAWNYRNVPSVGLAIAEAAGYDVAYYVGEGFKGILLDSNVILTKKNLSMTNVQYTKLPHSADSLGDGKTWVIPLGAVTWAITAKISLSDGQPVYLATSHLIGSSASDRGDQAKAIDATLRAQVAADGIAWDQANVVIAGDFNSIPSDPGPTYLMAQGYQDSLTVNHPGDTSCTNCGDPAAPWFDPIEIGAGLFPSQASEDGSYRFDYIFYHSPNYVPLASTLTFSQPAGGTWMSDHYGIFSTFGYSGDPAPANPLHDAPDNLSDTQVVTITDAQFLCTDPWNNSGSSDGQNCANQINPMVVTGARGLTIENRSSFYFEIAVDGPGDIFTARTAALNAGEEAAFSFNTPGKFTYTIQNLAQSPNPYRALISGKVQVQQTGY